MGTYHQWMEVVIGGTLAGSPVVNLPAGFDERGRPMGDVVFKDGSKEVVQFVANWCQNSIGACR